MDELCKSLGGTCKPVCGEDEFAANSCGTRATVCCVSKPKLMEEVETKVYDVESEESTSTTGWVIFGAILVGAIAYYILKERQP